MSPYFLVGEVKKVAPSTSPTGTFWPERGVAKTKSMISGTAQLY